MKKLIITFLSIFFAVSVHAQTWTAGTGLLYNNPLTTKIGIGTMYPNQALHVVNGNILISKTSTYAAGQDTNRAPGSTNGSIMFGSDITPSCISGNWAIEYLDGDDGAYGLNFWKPYNGCVGTGTMNFALFLQDNGNIGIGTSSPAEKLTVNGKICAKEVRVALSGAPCWPDYVFSPQHKLLSLEETEQYITKNKHLPEIPSSAEVEDNGIALGEMNALLLKKIEELTLHVIELQKQINDLKSNNKKGE
ncbi:MAG: hypothetical protein LBR51_01245 [Bacteroidales bacterium]|jgi:hypothetical protein|nr:hypothetical protein [Bacteroidales bacterium]